MRISEGVEWGIHCATLLAMVPDGVTLPASRLAEFHGVPPAYLAKALQGMVRAGIVDSVPGRKGGFRLARRAVEISVLDIVLAVDGDEPAFRCTEIRRRGPAAVPARLYAPTCGIAAVMASAEAAWRASLASTTVADLLVTLACSVSPEAAVKGATWLQEVLA